MSALSRHNLVYTEASTGFSHLVSTTQSSFKAVSLKWPLVWEWWVECTFQGQGGGEEPPIAQVQLEGQRSHPLNDLLTHLVISKLQSLHL